MALRHFLLVTLCFVAYFWSDVNAFYRSDANDVRRHLADNNKNSKFARFLDGIIGSERRARFLEGIIGSERRGRFLEGIIGGKRRSNGADEQAKRHDQRFLGGIIGGGEYGGSYGGGGGEYGSDGWKRNVDTVDLED